jgi:hypothetical protein
VKNAHFLPTRVLAFGLGGSVLFLAVFEVAIAVGLVTVHSKDVTLYRHYGEAMVHGAVPYRDVDIEYPPGALPLFAAPALLTGAPESYRHVFAVLMIVAVAALLACVRRLGAGVAVTVTVLVLIALMGSVALTRFDVVPAALTVAALAAFVLARWRLGALVLGIAIATKLYPVLLLPLVAVEAARRAGRRTAAWVTAIPLVVVALAYVPFVVLSPGGVIRSLDAQLLRPLEIESLGGTLIVGAHLFFGLHLPDQGSYYELPFHGADIVGDFSAALELAVLLALWVSFARSPRDAYSLVRFSAAAIATAVGFGKVFSPQYLLWLVPLVPLVPRRRGAYATALLAAACLITALVFPRHWEALKYDLRGLEIAAIIVRNLLLLGVVATLGSGLAFGHRQTQQE